MKHILTAVLALSAIAPAASSATHNPGALVHLTTRKWLTMDPADASDAVSFIVTGNVYESLISFKELKVPFEYVPFLAAQVPTKANKLLSADETVYRFPIRTGVTFHDGRPLTPEDVRYSILRFMLKDTEGGSSGILLNPILGVYSTRGADGAIRVDFKEAEKAVAVDGGDVVIRLKRPNGHFLKIMASLPIIVSKPWAVSHGEWDGTEASWKRHNNRPASDSYLASHANGTGPFAVETADPEKELVLKRNDKYWRAPAALSKVYLRIVPSKAMRLWMLETGDADASFFEDQDYSEVKDIPGVKIADSPHHTMLGEAVFFNFKPDAGADLGSGKLDGSGIPPDFFADRDVRDGFAHAIDYEGFLRRGMGMRGKRARGPFPDAFLPEQEPLPYEYDLAKAAAAFKRARGGEVWEKGFTATVSLSPSLLSRRILAEFIKAGVEKVNPKFKVRIKSMPSEELYTAMEKRRLALFITGFGADYPDPQSVASSILHSAGYFPQAQGYSNPELDGMIDAADAEADSPKLTRMYVEIGRKAAEDIAQIFTYNPTRFRAMRTWVRETDPRNNVNNLNLNTHPYFYARAKD
ncbi:MAG: ABC transporter substrate-binding protein [Elusimicrobia bacterium]|nr:ABC transporter substrate-binding protein [Elusimicrobiota bacterium]